MMRKQQKFQQFKKLQGTYLFTELLRNAISGAVPFCRTIDRLPVKGDGERNDVIGDCRKEVPA